MEGSQWLKREPYCFWQRSFGSPPASTSCASASSLTAVILHFWRLPGSVVVFVLFWRMFRGLVGKHAGRIHDFAEERQFFWRFFDARSFAIMAVMMTGGITIRVMHLAPDAFIAIFYTGLGTALALAGLAFGCQFFRYEEQG